MGEAKKKTCIEVLFLFHILSKFFFCLSVAVCVYFVF